MKRFGLKTIACGLALAMVASLGVPATAKAADLLIATNTAADVLVITQDMVDSDGELVLSGENLGKVVLPNDVKIKKLYIDSCTIGELSIESGNNPEVQIWSGKIDSVTVAAAELIDLNEALEEYLNVMKGKENTKEFDVSSFLEDVQSKNNRLSSMAPQINLMGSDTDDEQVIGSVNICGNAKVNFTNGKATPELNVNFASSQQKLDVTIDGYEGELNITQTTAKGDGFGIANIKAKNSNFTNVNVKADGNANIALRSGDSEAENVNVSSNGTSNAMFTLALDAENLTVAGSASNATVKVLTSLIKADVNGKNITLNLGPTASIETTNIAGSQNVVTGTGDLGECTIAEGSSASVQVPGAAVEGNNTYQPIVSAPSAGSGAGTATPTPTPTTTPSGSTPTPIPTLTYKASELGLGGYGAITQTTNADGSVTATFDDSNYYRLSFTLPASVSLTDYKTAVIEMSTDAGVYIETWDTAPLQGQWGDDPYQQTWTNTTNSKTIDLREINTGTYTQSNKTYTELSLAKISVQTLSANTEVTVKSITLIPEN